MNRSNSNKIFVAALAVACLLLGSPAAWAHRIDEYLQATILSLQPTSVHASMRLIPGVLVAPSIIAAIDLDQNGVFSPAEQRAYVDLTLSDLTLSIDQQPVKPILDTFTFPEPSQMRGGLGEILIQYHVDLPVPHRLERTLTLANHHRNANSVYLMNVEVPDDHSLQILGQRRNPQQSLYELDYQQSVQTQSAQPSGAIFSLARLQDSLHTLQFADLFHLGMRHIAEGTDHLLFLLVLLLPAPLCAKAHRWGPPISVRSSLLHLLGIVTAFTLGHSLTLTLAAMGVVRVPSRPVEILIAVSILVSALHALRPIFPGREAWIAVSFGLIHGLAFASTLDRLGLSRWDRLAGILAFNLGIEAMQMLVVALVLPSLLLLSRTPPYRILRIAGALFACAASLAWIAERLLNLRTPVDPIINSLAQHGLIAALTLFLISLACTALPVAKRSPQQA